MSFYDEDDPVMNPSPEDAALHGADSPYGKRGWSKQVHRAAKDLEMKISDLLVEVTDALQQGEYH